MNDLTDKENTTRRDTSQPLFFNSKLRADKKQKDSTSSQGAVADSGKFSGFGNLPKEKFEEEYLRLIKADIADAQKHLEELPERDRRGLMLDTLRHFHCGYLPKWILTKSRAEFSCGLYINEETSKPKHLPPPSPRIIIPTHSMQHFNAVATERLDMDKAYWKQHAGTMELFGDPAALNADLIIVVEGELDAMSIWQCFQGNIATVAILGCGNWKKTLLPKLNDLQGKHFLLLMDADAAGKKSAKKLLEELQRRGCIAVVKYLYDALPKEEQIDFGWKVDANSILQHNGNEYLKDLLEKIIADAYKDFKTLEEKAAQWKQFVEENNARPEPQLSLPTSKKSSTTRPTDEDIDTNEIKLILEKYVHAKKLERDEWAIVGMILYRYGFTLDDFKEWSNKGDSRYDAKTCADQWHSFKTAGELHGKGYTIATLIHIAKQFGYETSKKSDEPQTCQPVNLSTCQCEDTSPMTKDFVTDCPVNLRLPTGFIFGNEGIEYEKKPATNTKPAIYIPVAHTPLVVTKILSDAEIFDTMYQVGIKINNTWRYVSFDGRTLQDPRKVFDLTSKGALIEEPAILAKYFSRLIAINYDLLPKVKIYTQPGWHDGKFIYPVPADDDDYICKRGGFNYSQEFATQGNANIWKATFLDACDKGGAKARIAFGNVFAAPLLRPLNLPNNQCQLDGKSGGGKTALLKFAASAFGNPRKLIRTFGATLKNRQAVAAAYNDLPTFLDELGTLQGGKKGAETLPQMVYDYEQGKANQAQKKNGESRETFEFCGSRTMTGEFSILKSHDPRGTHKRVIPLDCGEKLFDDEFATELHITAENHFGHFGRQWTKYVENHLETIRESYLCFTKYIYHEKKINVESTLLKAITVDAVAYQHFRICIGEQEIFDFIAAVKDIIAIISTLPTPADLDESTRAIKDLQSYIAGHEKYFDRDIPDNSAEGYTPIHSQAWESFGKKFSTGEIAFLPHALKKILENELGYQSADALIREFAQKGLLRCTKGRGYRYSTWLNGKSEPTIRFKADAFPKTDIDENFNVSSDTESVI